MKTPNQNKLEISNRVVYLLLLLVFIAGGITIFTTHNSFGGGDNFSHYKFAHWGWKYHNLLFNHWGKPVFTILMSPFAQLGINTARIYNLIMGILTAIVIWKTAEVLKFKNAVVSLLLVLFTPIYFIMMFTTLTEVSFSFFISLAILLFFKNKYLLSAIIVSLLPLIRTEGIVVLPLFIAAYSFRRQFIAIPFLAVGFFVITLLGWQFYSDFWWLITKMPYSGSAKDIYGSGSLFRFLMDTRGILGYPIAVLFVTGLFISIRDWVIRDKYGTTETFYFLLLVTGSYIVFLSAHSFVWWQGIGNSLGLIRVIASVAPLAALTAVPGLSWLMMWGKSKNKLTTNVITLMLMLWIVVLGINTHIGGFHYSRVEKLVRDAAQYLKENKLDKYKIFYYDSQIIINLQIDPFDRSRSKVGVLNKQHPAMSMPDSAILVWDAHFGPNEGRLPLSHLKNSKNLTLLKVIKPIHPFKVLGGYDYAIYIFQKSTKKTGNLNDSITQPNEEFIIDCEDYIKADSTISCSGNRSLSVTPQQEYVHLIDTKVSNLTLPSLSSIKVDFNAALYCDKQIGNKNVKIVCTLENDGHMEIYKAIDLVDPIKIVNKWNLIQCTFRMDNIIDKQSNLKLYIWNKSSTEFNIDKIKIEIGSRKKVYK